MGKFTGGVIAVLILILANIGIFEGVNDLLDTKEKDVISSCTKNGYWQYKQRRFICYEEKK